MEKNNDWNSLVIIGSILDNPEYYYEVVDRTYYIINIEVNIKDNKNVIIPVVINDADYRPEEYKAGQKVFVKGFIETQRLMEKSKTKRLQMYIKPRIIDQVEFDNLKKLNNAIIQGYVCNKIEIKKNYNGKERLALLVASNMEDTSNYIRCFIIGERAEKLKDIKLNEKIELHGHIEYNEIRKEHQLFVKWCDKTDNGYINKDGYQFGIIK